MRRTAGPGALRAARVRFGLVHPFPSILNGGVTLALAAVAGADPPTAVRLGVAMTALQFSIGALNDLHDAPRDGGRRPPKPIPAGLVRSGTAARIAALGATVGLALALVSGPRAVAVAGLGLALGYTYDLGLSRTVWAWAPLTLALPLVPVFAWVGAVGSVPPAVVDLVPVAMLAGMGLAIGNSLADLAADAAAGSPSIARRWGDRRAWVIHALALSVAVGLSIWQLPPSPSGGGVVAMLGGSFTIALGGLLLVTRAPARRRAAWAIEAMGVGMLGVGWFMIAMLR